jgi:hypothetical protein
MDSGRGVAPGDGDAEFPRAKGLLRTRDGPLGAGALMLLWQMRRVYLVVSMSRIMWRLRVGSRFGGACRHAKAADDYKLCTMMQQCAVQRESSRM